MSQTLFQHGVKNTVPKPALPAPQSRDLPSPVLNDQVWSNSTARRWRCAQSAPHDRIRKNFDVRPHRRGRRTVQSYSPRDASVLPSEHPSPQLKRQIDRFRHFGRPFVNVLSDRSPSCLSWPNGWMDQDATNLDTEVGNRPRPHCITSGPRSLYTCSSPHFCDLRTPISLRPYKPRSISFYCGQTARWIRILVPCTWYAGNSGRPRPGRHCVRWWPNSASPDGAQSPNVWPMSVVAKRPDGLRCHLLWR